MNQLLGTVTHFVKFWDLGEFSSIDGRGSSEELKQSFLQINQEGISTIIKACSDGMFMALEIEWLKLFVCSGWEAVHACYIGEMFEDLKTLFQFG